LKRRGGNHLGHLLVHVNAGDAGLLQHVFAQRQFGVVGEVNRRFTISCFQRCNLLHVQAQCPAFSMNGTHRWPGSNRHVRVFIIGDSAWPFPSHNPSTRHVLRKWWP
jgi:hypothetical protein